MQAQKISKPSDSELEAFIPKMINALKAL